MQDKLKEALQERKDTVAGLNTKLAQLEGLCESMKRTVDQRKFKNIQNFQA